jgi:diguanylate cyclase (GGDEF)-like protein
VTHRLGFPVDANVYSRSPSSWIASIYAGLIVLVITVLLIGTMHDSFKQLLTRSKGEMRRFPAWRIPIGSLGCSTSGVRGIALLTLQRKNRSVICFFLDLDGFKQINDLHGLSAGDEVLRTVSGRLVQAVRAEDTVARVGGDEFIVLVDEASSAADVELIASRMVSRQSEPLFASERTLQVGVSVGIGRFDGDDSKPLISVDELLNRADQAMYRVKRAGKNAFGY